MHEYHDSVVHVPGLTRRDKRGHKIKALGLKEAARIASLNVSDMGNRLNPNMPEHRPTLEGFVLHLLNGLDVSVLDALESELGRVAIDVPDVQEYADLQSELLACIQGFGDVGKTLQAAMQPDSHHGSRISRREFKGIKKTIEGEVAELYALLSAIEESIE